MEALSRIALTSSGSLLEIASRCLVRTIVDMLFVRQTPIVFTGKTFLKSFLKDAV